MYFLWHLDYQSLNNATVKDLNLLSLEIELALYVLTGLEFYIQMGKDVRNCPVQILYFTRKQTEAQRVDCSRLLQW